MFAVLLLVQFLTSLGLALWLALAPRPSLLALLAQLLGTGLLTLALMLGGLWVWPGVWAPWLLGAAWLLAAALAVWRRPASAPVLPDGRPASRIREWLGILVNAGLAGLAALLLAETIAGWRPADVPIVDLAPPLVDGRYLVGHGGSTSRINPHLAALDPANERLAPYRGQAYALDILGLDGLGRRAGGLYPADLEAYRIFGVPVVAPCAGPVLATETDLPDLPVATRDRDNPAGNHVLLGCGDAVVVLGHLQAGSVAVHPGERVEVGAPLGRVGNSGNSSEPHLHIHAQLPALPATPLAGEPLQITIEGRYLVRNDRLDLRS